MINNVNASVKKKIQAGKYLSFNEIYYAMSAFANNGTYIHMIHETCPTCGHREWKKYQKKTPKNWLIIYEAAMILGRLQREIYHANIILKEIKEKINND